MAGFVLVFMLLLTGAFCERLDALCLILAQDHRSFMHSHGVVRRLGCGTASLLSCDSWISKKCWQGFFTRRLHDLSDFLTL
ncbi:hypothetical protein CKO33_08250 [Ectothiorhodospira mobilis]|nr:hypothetical protein [Ectothiorhodospira mobilis]